MDKSISSGLFLWCGITGFADAAAHAVSCIYDALCCLISLHKHPCHTGKRQADEDSADCGNQEGHKGPFEASGFPPYGKQCGGAGPVHQGEKHGAHRGYPGPAIVHQQFLKLGQAVKFQDAALCHVGHDDDGNHDFVGRKSQDECHEYDAVHTQQPCKGIQEAGTVGQQCDLAHLDICHDPDEKSRGRGHHDGPSQHEQGAVKDGTDNDLPNLGTPVGRQLQGEGGGDSL